MLEHKFAGKMLINLLEICSVGCAEEFGLGDLGDFLQALFVDLRVEGRKRLAWDHAIGGAKGNCVDLHAFAGSQLPLVVWQTMVAQGAKTNWQIQLEWPKSQGEVQTLLLRGARLAQLDGEGVLLVFDDVSDVMLAQKAQAWGEVARRLAHEIKNPLTPIQLSAERMEMKLHAKLAAPEQAILAKSVKTIVEYLIIHQHTLRNIFLQHKIRYFKIIIVI